VDLPRRHGQVDAAQDLAMLAVGLLHADMQVADLKGGHYCSFSVSCS